MKEGRVVHAGVFNKNIVQQPNPAGSVLLSRNESRSSNDLVLITIGSWSKQRNINSCGHSLNWSKQLGKQENRNSTS
eukprot:1160665-Pelagomonas_calceolata.AAC.7